MKKSTLIYCMLIVSASFLLSCGSKPTADKPRAEQSSGQSSQQKSQSPESGTSQPSLAKDANFRKAKWGITKDEVRKQEENAPIQETPKLLGYQGRVQGMDCLIAYIFAKNKLVRAKYVIQAKHSHKNDYISDFDNLKKALSEKYGSPSQSRILWKDDSYKDDPQHYGLAVAMGHLMYFTQWETEPTTITLMLNGDNFDITLGIEYLSKKHAGLEDQEQKEESAGEL